MIKIELDTEDKAKFIMKQIELQRSFARRIEIDEGHLWLQELKPAPVCDVPKSKVTSLKRLITGMLP